MKNLLKTVLLAVVVVCYWPMSLSATTTHADSGEQNHFFFVISKFHTERQSGRTVNIYVKFAYKKDLPTSAYPDYRILRTRILQYMDPSDAFPADTWWEILAANMGRELMKDFPLVGVSIQLTVLDDKGSDNDEPGDHGPVFTMGDIEPLDVH